MRKVGPLQMIEWLICVKAQSKSKKNAKKDRKINEAWCILLGKRQQAQLNHLDRFIASLAIPVII
ncbi:MAG: hypothetical protein K940chlam3_01758 [Chlamydiae bacterium]|nr:hypothetical protein [Chlamydiota bacterium]